jgi:hypothetical protein
LAFETHRQGHGNRILKIRDPLRRSHPCRQWEGVVPHHEVEEVHGFGEGRSGREGQGRTAKGGGRRSEACTAKGASEALVRSKAVSEVLLAPTQTPSLNPLGSIRVGFVDFIYIRPLI